MHGDLARHVLLEAETVPVIDAELGVVLAGNECFHLSEDPRREESPIGQRRDELNEVALG